MPAKLTKDEANAFLDSKPGWIALTTIGPEGYPHTVPIGYFRLGDEVYIGCRANTRKLKNIDQNGKVSLMIESGESMKDIKGLLIQGEGSYTTDPVELLRLSREAARKRGVSDDQLPTSPPPGSAYIKVVPVKYISWDYSR